MAKSIWQKPSDNQLSSATLTNPTNGSASGYALTDLYNGNPAFGWHASAASTFYILLDFGAVLGRAVKLIGFHNHNFDDGVVLTIQGNATDSWGAPTVNSTVTVPAVNADGFRTDFYWLNASQSSSLRYWRIGTTTTNSAAWILGQLWVSNTIRYLPFDQMQMNPGLSIKRVRPVVEHLTPPPYNVSLRYPSASRYTVLSGLVKGVRSDVENLRDSWFSTSLGRAVPTTFVNEDTGSGAECFFVIHDQDDMDASQVNGQIWQAPIVLRTLATGPGW